MSDDFVKTKSLALVGRFLQIWSDLEHMLHMGIAAATKLDPLMNTVICANLTIREKLHILRTLVDISAITADNKTRYKGLLRDIADYSTTRNMIAHDYFGTGESKPGIAFLTVKAKGSFSTPSIVWTEEDFEREYKKMREFREEAIQVAIALEHTTFSADDLLIPIKIVDSEARRRLRSRPPEVDPDSRQATPEKSSETPDES